MDLSLLRGHHTGIVPPSGPLEATSSLGVCALVGYGFPPSSNCHGKEMEGREGEGEEGKARRASKAVIMPGAIATCATL
jgi:hypothetical protein